MNYNHIEEGRFISRPNRFIAQVDINGQEHSVHVKNTGRCKELLIPGARVFLEKSTNPNRKTGYDLVAVYKEDRLINMDSQVPNTIFKEWVQGGHFVDNVQRIKVESTYKSSRFDFYIEALNPDGTTQKIYVETKGVTLEENGICRFPDAPTQRGIKHLRELMEAVTEGYQAYVVFIVQMKDVDYFAPNENTHPEFAQALREAASKGVHVLALECEVTHNGIQIIGPIPFRLQE